MRALYIALATHVVVGQQPINDLLKGFITPQDGTYPVKEACDKAGKDYINGLVGNPIDISSPDSRESSLMKFDASALFPPSGLASDTNWIHFPGSFSGCINVEDHGYKGEPGNPDLDGRYALLLIVDYETLQQAAARNDRNDLSIPEVLAQIDGTDLGQQPLFLPERRILEAYAKSQGSHGPLVSGLVKVGKCVPKVCDDADITAGAINYLTQQSVSKPDNASNPNDYVYAVVLNSHSKDEEMELSTADIVMISVVALFVFVIALSTWLDVSITVLDLPYVPKTLLPYFQGFSAYHNIIKICKVDSGPNDGSNLSCINGLKYITITWIVLGHTLAEYTLVLSAFGIFSSSVDAHMKASTGFPFVAVWNGLLGVDTFLVIGGCLLAFHTLKELDKTKGGSIGMWVMFYVHRLVLYTL